MIFARFYSTIFHDINHEKRFKSLFAQPSRNLYSDTPNAKELYASVGKILMYLSIYPSEKGFEYLRCAIILTYHSPEITEYVTKTLYPRVAKLCRCDCPANVGRSCRRSIEASYKRGFLSEYFDGDEPPRCADFVTGIANYLRSKAKS